MNTSLQLSSAETLGDLARLRTWLAARGTTGLATLERHLARPRYRPAFTRIAERDGQIAGYALIGHQRLRLGAATLETGDMTAIDSGSAQDSSMIFDALLGDCLGVLVEEGLALATLHGSVANYGAFGFAEYLF